MSLENCNMCSDGMHCDGECPHLKIFGQEMDLTAKCDISGNDLMFHDYWIAECEADKEDKQ